MLQKLSHDTAHCKFSAIQQEMQYSADLDTALLDVKALQENLEILSGILKVENTSI